MADAQAVIQATLAPVFLISGGSIFLTYVQARLFRVTDRLRILGQQMRLETDPERYGELEQQLKRVIRRAAILRNGVLFGVLVVAFTVLSALLLLVPSVWTSIDLESFTIATFGAALVCFFVTLTCAVMDSYLSVATARHLATSAGHLRLEHEDD